MANCPKNPNLVRGIRHKEMKVPTIISAAPGQNLKLQGYIFRDSRI